MTKLESMCENCVYQIRMTELVTKEIPTNIDIVGEIKEESEIEKSPIYRVCCSLTGAYITNRLIVSCSGFRPVPQP